MARLSRTKNVIFGAVCVAGLLLSQPSLADDVTASSSAVVDPGFDNSPNDIDNQLKEADDSVDAILQVDPLEPLHERWKRATRQLRTSVGLNLGLTYTALYQNANTALQGKRSEAAGGDLDFFGRWNLFRRDAIVFATETRHRYTAIPPSQLGDNIGSLWGTVVSFDTFHYALPQLYWEHGSAEDHFISRVGKMDPADIYDGFRFGSSNYAFLSPAFSDTLAMPTPSTGLGAAAGLYPTANTYILAGIHDTNGSETTLGKIDRGEFFMALEFGATPHRGKPGAGLYHVTLWHSDERDQADVAGGRGVAVTVQQEFGPGGNVVPFVRYSYAEGGATKVRQTFAAGIGLEEPFGQNHDLIGVGLSWGEPEDRTLRDQYVVEAFYRVLLTPHTHLTPDIQVIVNPTDNLSEQRLIVGSVRLRTLF